MLCWLQITLDVQLKSEQESIEGLPAIIASIEGQGQGMSSINNYASYIVTRMYTYSACCCCVCVQLV